jgi:hypothetical protein
MKSREGGSHAAPSFWNAVITNHRAACQECGNRMMLARIEPDKPKHDKRTFECFECGHSESVVVKYQ